MRSLSRPTVATYAGLFCALGLPLLILPTRLLLRIHAELALQEAIMWGLAVFVLAVLILGEKLPLSAIGLGRLTWKSLVWGTLGAIAIRILAAAVLLIYAKTSGTTLGQDFAHDIGTVTRLGSLPLATVFLLALRAGVVEEVLFRGFGIERLAAVTRNRVTAAAISLTVFTFAHLGGWDIQFLIVVFPAGLVLTLLFLWRRDLWANIWAHFLTDAISLAGAYAIAHHMVHVQGIPAS